MPRLAGMLTTLAIVHVMHVCESECPYSHPSCSMGCLSCSAMSCMLISGQRADRARRGHAVCLLRRHVMYALASVFDSRGQLRAYQVRACYAHIRKGLYYVNFTVCIRIHTNSGNLRARMLFADAYLVACLQVLLLCACGLSVLLLIWPPKQSLEDTQVRESDSTHHTKLHSGTTYPFPTCV